MDPQELNSRIIETGRELLGMLEGGKPTLFEEGQWVGKIMGWSLKDEAFRVSLLRFVDVFPSLSTPASLVRHLTEYFDGRKGDVPTPVRLAVRLAARGGRAGGRAPGQGNPVQHREARKTVHRGGKWGGRVKGTVEGPPRGVRVFRGRPR